MDTFQNQKQLYDYQSIQNKNRSWSETGNLVISKNKYRHPEISWNLDNWRNTEKSQVPGDLWGKDVINIKMEDYLNLTLSRLWLAMENHLNITSERM